MTTWTSDELDKVGVAEELEMKSLRRDGTLRKRVVIWVVRVADGLYIRAYKGRTGPWFLGAQTRHEGHIRAGLVSKDVTFVEAGEDDDLNDQIDAAYRDKYCRYPANVLDPIVTALARSATLKLVPR